MGPLMFFFQTDSIMVNHHFAPAFGIVIFLLFPSVLRVTGAELMFFDTPKNHMVIPTS